MSFSFADSGFQPLAGFVAPELPVAPLARAEAWDQLPMAPLFTDLLGEESYADAPSVQLAYDEKYLYLRARNCPIRGTCAENPLPGTPDFWRQDHIELRLLPDPTKPEAQLQFILGMFGRHWANQEKLGAAVRYDVEKSTYHWSCDFAVPHRLLGVAVKADAVVAGLVAHTSWSGSMPRFACVTPANLGYSHFAHFAVLRFLARPPVLALQRLELEASPHRQARVAAVATIRNNTNRAIAGVLQERVLLKPGLNKVALRLPLRRDAYTHYEVTVKAGAQTHALGSVTLRRAVGPVAALRVEQPRLLLDENGLGEMATKMRMPEFAPLVRVMEDITVNPPPTKPPEMPAAMGKQHGGLHLDLISEVGKCLSKWLLTRDASWIRQASALMAAADKYVVLPKHFDLKEGNTAPIAALTFDAFGPHLSAEERRTWVRVLTRMLDCYVTTSRHRAWTVTAIPNANAVTNAGGGMLALALFYEHPLAQEALGYARKHTRIFLDYCQGANDGGNTEGPQYWAYGLESLLRFALVLERVTGEREIIDHPSVQKTMNNVRASLCNDGACSGVNDTVPMPVGAEVAWCMSNYTNDPLALWYGDHAMQRIAAWQAQGRQTAYFPSTFFGMVARPAVKSPVKAPPLPTAVVLHDIEVAMLRSEPTWDCVLDCGIKGSRPPYTHHNQPDTGAFFLDLRGERLIIDPGYYKPEPTDHSLPLIDGVGPAIPTLWNGRVLACRAAGDLRYMMCDSTQAYGAAAKRVRRHVVMFGAQGVLVLDDIVPARKGAKVTLQYQCGGVTARDRKDGQIHVNGHKAALRIGWLGPMPTQTVLQAERRFDDVHWGYVFADCKWFPVRADYRGVPRGLPLMTTFSDETTGAGPLWRCSQRGDRLIVAVEGVGEVGFQRRISGWELVAM